MLKGDDFAALKRQVDGDMIEAARHAISTHRVKAARAWTRAVDVAAEKGDHKPAKDLLIHTDVIKPIGETTGLRLIVKIGGDPPGSPGYAVPSQAQIIAIQAERQKAIAGDTDGLARAPLVLEAVPPKPDTPPD